MSRSKKKAFVSIVLVALLLGTLGAPARAQEPFYADVQRTPMRMFGDLVLLRPLGLLSTVFGSAVFVVGLPFSAIGGNVGETAQKLIADPAKFTFVRPLGQLPESRHGD